MGLSNALLRTAAMGNNFMIVASSAIVTGLASWFLAKSGHRASHIVYQEVIAVMTLGFYLIALVMPLIGKYEGHLAPLNVIFSYLWLTSFILSTQAWTGGKCHDHGPMLGRCGRKHTIMAFNFLGFFFLFCNVVIEGLLLRASRRTETERVVKERPGTSSTAATTA